MMRRHIIRWSWATFLSMVLVLSGAAVGAAGQHKQKEQDAATAAEVQEKAAATYQAMKEYSAEQRDEAIAAAQKRLRQLDARIETMQQNLDENWQEMSQGARQKSRATMDRLRQQRREVAEWYGGIQHSSAEAWEKVKKGFAASYDRLENAVFEARKEFTEGGEQKQKGSSDQQGD